jgi:hypothetical protein
MRRAVPLLAVLAALATPAGLPPGGAVYLATISGQTVTAPILGRFAAGALRGFTRGTIVMTLTGVVVNPTSRNDRGPRLAWETPAGEHANRPPRPAMRRAG